MSNDHIRRALARMGEAQNELHAAMSLGDETVLREYRAPASLIERAKAYVAWSEDFSATCPSNPSEGYMAIIRDLAAAQPEPSPSEPRHVGDDKLRRLRGWAALRCEAHKRFRGEEAAFQRYASKAFHEVCQEIDRLLAEDEPETPGDEVLRAVLGFPDPEASEHDGSAYVPSILALKELCRRALEKP